MRANTEQMEAQIVAALKSIPSQLNPDQSEIAWRNTVKGVISKLGEQHGYTVLGLPESLDREWVFDLCWYRDGEGGKPCELALALQAEWQMDYTFVHGFFHQLLPAKSKFKVMIFRAKGWTQMERYITLAEEIEYAHSTGGTNEIYLLVCFNEDAWDFQIKRIEFSAHSKPVATLL
jgi:hypothetical protein